MSPQQKAQNLFELYLKTIRDNLSVKFEQQTGMFGKKTASPIVKVVGIEKAAYKICESLILVELSKVAKIDKNPYHFYYECEWHQYSDYWNEVYKCFKIIYEN